MRATGLLLLLIASSSPAIAQTPVYKDAEGFAVRPDRRIERRVYEFVEPVPMVTRRRCCDGYVGSSYGLGKPNVYGISPRPDDGTLH